MFSPQIFISDRDLGGLKITLSAFGARVPCLSCRWTVLKVGTQIVELSGYVKYPVIIIGVARIPNNKLFLNLHTPMIPILPHQVW